MSKGAGSRAFGLILLVLLGLASVQFLAAEKAGGNRDVSKEAADSPDTVASEEHAHLPLSSVEDSLDGLARKFLDTLAEGDRDKIKAMALTEDEFVSRIYPALPASQPGSNLSAEFLWRQTLLRNLAGLQKTMRFAGRRFDFVSLRCVDGVKDYAGFKVHRDVRLTVKDADGKELEMKFFGAALEAGGKFKIYSFAH